MSDPEERRCFVVLPERTHANLLPHPSPVAPNPHTRERTRHAGAKPGAFSPAWIESETHRNKAPLSHSSFPTCLRGSMTGFRSKFERRIKRTSGEQKREQRVIHAIWGTTAVLQALLYSKMNKCKKKKKLKCSRILQYLSFCYRLILEIYCTALCCTIR